MSERSMVDANVLIFAFRIIKPGGDPKVTMWHEASLALLRQMPVVRVVSVAWMEFARGLRPEEMAAQPKLYRKIRVEAVDGPIADRAVQLLEARNQHDKPCRTCNNVPNVPPCSRCGRLLSSKRNLNDAIVMAAAEHLDDVDTLYCYDSGLMDFGRFIDQGRCRVVEPPNPSGPLFDKRR